MVIGGGMAKHWDKYTDTLDESLPLMPATLGNNAGLIGAALMAAGS
jgi:polyphosphate glucokinase